MQWRDATVSGTGATGFQAPGPVAARQEPACVRQVFAAGRQVRQVDGPGGERDESVRGGRIAQIPAAAPPSRRPA